MSSPDPEPAPVRLDLADFDAVTIATDIVVALRVHAIEAGLDAAATVSTPPGWHPVTVTARASGHVVLAARLDELTASRYHNVAAALTGQGWQPDEDGDGTTRRFPPGSDPSEAAFALLAALPAAGAPRQIREVTATDASGRPVPLAPG